MNEEPNNKSGTLTDAVKYELSAMISETRYQCYSGYTHFLKGDISGIQDFIFNVKSEKAAKTLKARSYFIQALSEICVQFILGKLNGRAKILYNGGGNFYLFISDEIVGKLPEIQEAVNEICEHEEFYVTLSVVEAGNATDGFGENTWKPVQKDSAGDKLKKFEGYSGAFEAYTAPQVQKWEDFTPNFIRSTGREISGKGQQKLFVNHKGMEALNYSLTLCKQKANTCRDDSFEKSIVNKIPRWSDDLLEVHAEELNKYFLGKENQRPKKGQNEVIEFHELSYFFAKKRTGTNKLAVLAMDIDSLGKLFDKSKNIADLKATSDLLKWFFDEQMLNLWNQSFIWFDKEKGAWQTAKFSENIYVVFSGGDDCFLLGAWDAVFEFATLAHKKFGAFGKFLEEKIHFVPYPPTLSAGLIVVDPNYPVVRFAKLAKDALRKSKAIMCKNRITVFGQTLTWEEFAKAKELSEDLRCLIHEKDEPRAILERIKRSAAGFDNLQQAALEGRLRAPKVSRLFYFLRNLKKENRDTVEKIVQDYSNSLIAAFQQKKTLNPMTFPVGARWAEFLTR